MSEKLNHVNEKPSSTITQYINLSQMNQFTCPENKKQKPISIFLFLFHFAEK